MSDHETDHVARYEGVIDRFVTWASSRPDVQAAFIVGSRAREDHPADEWSDLDVVMFADEPARILDDEAWLSAIGEWSISFREPTAVGIWEERRVLFANGCDADFSILPASLIDDLDHMRPGDPLHEETAGVVSRGYRILVDKDRRLRTILPRMSATASSRPAPPTQAQFDQMLSDFWYHCVWLSRKLRRGELAVAHECLEGNQRGLLMRFIRWLGERDGDTWHGTRFFERWAPPEAVDRFAGTYASHDAADIHRALREMMDLVAWLAREIAGSYRLTVQDGPEHAARRWMQELSVG